MAEASESLVLEHLRAIRGTLAQHTEEFHFLRERMNSIERQAAGLHSDGATVNAQLESIKKRLERIEKRLELTDA